MSSNFVYRRPFYNPVRFNTALFFGEVGPISASLPITYGENFVIGSLTAVEASLPITYSETLAAGAYGNAVASIPITYGETLQLGALGNISANLPITYGHLFRADVFFVQPILAIVPPKMRSIDAKSLADHFNRGQPRKPDYEWEGKRKFFQDDSPA